MKKLFFLLTAFALVLSCSSDETSTPVTPPPAPIVKYTITLSAGEGGTVSTTGGEYEAGQTVSVTATPQGEYLFKDWSDGNTDATRTITIDSTKTLTANFEKRKYPLTINFVGEGEVKEEIVNAGRTTDYDSGTTVKLTAVPAEGWVFVGWTGAIESTELEVQLLVSEAKEINAEFKKIELASLVLNEKSKMFTKGVADTLLIPFKAPGGFKGIKVNSQDGLISIVSKPIDGVLEGEILISYVNQKVSNVDWQKTFSGHDNITFEIEDLIGNVNVIEYKLRTQPEPKFHDYNKSYDDLKALAFPIEIQLIRHLNQKDNYQYCDGETGSLQTYYDFKNRIRTQDSQSSLNQFDAKYGIDNSFSPDYTDAKIFADFNNDGYLDLMTHPYYLGIDGHGVHRSEVEFYFYDDGEYKFFDMKFENGDSPTFYFSRRGIITGDFDLDGDPDIIISSVNHDDRSQLTNVMLLENKINQSGGFYYHDLGFSTHFLFTGSGDIDQDGDLDVLVLGGYEAPNVEYTLMHNQGNNNFLIGENGALFGSTKYNFRFDPKIPGSDEYLRFGGEGNPIIDDFDNDGNVDLLIPGNEWSDIYLTEINPQDQNADRFIGKYRYGVNKIIWGNNGNIFDSTNEITYLPKTPSWGTSIGSLAYDIDNDGVKEIFLNKTGSAHFEGNDDPVNGWYIQCIKLSNRSALDITNDIFDIYKSTNNNALPGSCERETKKSMNMITISDYDNNGTLNFFHFGRTNNERREWEWNGSKFIKIK